jgi:3-methyl-2-oxobutanoate hydroxymethyltransferase
MVTCYDSWSANLLKDCPVDILLVGDSVMMVHHGHKDTLGATIDIMELHTAAVARSCHNKLIVADMPFLAARKSRDYALDCAARLLRAGAHAVKIEGLRGQEDIMAHLVESGIPVMGHLGLTPQWVHTLGGFTVQAREAESASRLLVDAKALQQLGVCSLVLECIPQGLAQEVTRELQIPSIGIGAGVQCDGQVLVLHDLLGLNPDFKPKFVRHYLEGAQAVREAVTQYANDVGAGSFPGPKECFTK